MSARTTIAVVGATGTQGGGLAGAILDDPDSPFVCRVITRNPESVAAQALADRGAEVVQADLDDAGSLTKAFRGAYGAYCMTNFFEHFSADRELEQARNLANAVQAAGISHAVWSTHQDSRNRYPLSYERLPALPGRYKLPHWDAKAEANRFFLASGVPTTFLCLPAFWDNFLTPGAPQRPQRGPNGVLAIMAPMGDMRLAGIAGADVGRCAYGIFKKGRSFAGATVGVVAEFLTGAELANGLSAAAGEEIQFHHVPVEAVRASGLPGAELVANMFQMVEENLEGFCASYDPDLSRLLNPKLQSFEGWLAANGHLLREPAGAR